MNRRSFLAKTSALAASGTAAPGLWGRTALAASAEPGPDAPILVVIELTGGNDGLNMVIPFRDDIYHRSRPNLRIAPEKVLKLDDALGLHPTMTGLHRTWEAGKLRVITNVGYPRPSRSHFRSMEIWQTADLGDAPTSGWLGRVADHAHDPACFVGAGPTPMAVQGREVAPFALGDLEDMKLRPGARLATPSDPRDDPSPSARASLALVRAQALSSRVKSIRSDEGGGDRDGLAAQLATVRALIESGSPTRVYYTALDGFDTHAAQEFTHLGLLRGLSKAVREFQDDLEARKLDDRVVVLVFSEFGRRVEENGSLGTDHGAAAPVLLIGSRVRPGLLGGPPNLADLDEGDVRHAVDFRDLYASLLRGWLGIAPASVLGTGRDATLPLIRS